MLLYAGTDDQGGIPWKRTLSTFESTCKHHFSDPLEFVTLKGVEHFPSMDVTRRHWPKWVEDRFFKKPMKSDASIRSTLDGFLPEAYYQNISSSFTQLAAEPGDFYELVVGSF